MYLSQQKALAQAVRTWLKERHDLTPANLAIEQPPQIALGEYALPLAFELARSLRKAPKVIAAELAEGLNGLVAEGRLLGFAGFEAAGSGYLNVRLDRRWTAATFAQSGEPSDVRTLPELKGVVDVEHTSINPNKAAHIGHLRNAILGDTFARLLREYGDQVVVLNYIDNTGVQVADVVVGFLHLEKKSLSEIEAIIAAHTGSHLPVAEQFDYLCWSLYARVSQWYEAGNDEEKKARRTLRLDTLHAIEQGGNEVAQAADAIAMAVLRRHLETMERLSIEYDFMPRESEVLHLRFWDHAFELMKQKGVLYLEAEGKNKGCWVMRRAGSEAEETPAAGPDENAKILVRSNGTVTYVGKDIAYHLWKFGLLEGLDFGDRPFFTYQDGRECAISSDSGKPELFKASGAERIYNVIDSRQTDPQANVVEALRGMGYAEQADSYTHLSYEMVALTPRCALELGYEVAEEDRSRSYIEVSGRKGFGVKADDLLDKLIAATRAEVDQRHPEMDELERARTATQIAVGALRYFMLRFTRNTVIAFDTKDALSFEGETGPYIQYAVVRARNIFRKAGLDAVETLVSFDAKSDLLEQDDVWQLWLTASRSRTVLDQAVVTAEPAHMARHAFQLAQEFNNFYHRHHILTEEDPDRKKALLATAAIAERELVRMLGWMGIESPERM